ncbi:MAG TPA: hypothetical protein VK906_08385 [Egicoccus sp.]|nr:hypothetical protein [Egicoccus sp.]HSK23178.1 hypothetical protein [Egicoccus sp.]
MDDRGSFEPRRPGAQDPGTPPPDASAGHRAWLLHHGAEYTFFEMVRRRRGHGLSVRVLVGLLLVQALVVALLVYWVM